MDTTWLPELRSEFDALYYDQPDVDGAVDVEKIRGGHIEDTENLLHKLDLAVEAQMDFVAIGDVEYMFETQDSLEKFVMGIKIGKEFDGDN